MYSAYEGEIILERKVPVRAHVYITGRVQGVNFRYYTRQQAARLGLNGWVRNLRDGRVEMVIEGLKPLVDQMLAWCDHGPSSARVDRIEVEWEGISERMNDFTIRYWGG